jgi:phosphatidylglycerophosphate synthase
MSGASWTHRLAAVAVRPLIGSGVTPNHLTTLRLVTGLLACAALLPGDRSFDWWAGWLWLISAFLDRADGVLARIGHMSTPAGRRYDYLADSIVNPAFFIALGIGLRHFTLGNSAIVLGLWTGAAIYVSAHWCATSERPEGSPPNVYPGAFGFDFDDLLYVLAPVIWLGWNAQLLVFASVGASFMLLLTGWQFWRPIGGQSGTNRAE